MAKTLEEYMKALSQQFGWIHMQLARLDVGVIDQHELSNRLNKFLASREAVLGMQGELADHTDPKLYESQ